MEDILEKCVESTLDLKHVYSIDKRKGSYFIHVSFVIDDYFTFFDKLFSEAEEAVLVKNVTEWLTEIQFEVYKKKNKYRDKNKALDALTADDFMKSGARELFVMWDVMSDKYVLFTKDSPRKRVEVPDEFNDSIAELLKD